MLGDILHEACYGRESGSDRTQLWVYDGQGKVLGQVTAPFETESQPPGRGVAVVEAGEVVMATEESIVRVSIRFEP